jgi:hypothetical protein
MGGDEWWCEEEGRIVCRHGSSVTIRRREGPTIEQWTVAKGKEREEGVN